MSCGSGSARDWTPICVAVATIVIVGRESAPTRNVEAEVTYASAGTGSGGWLPPQVSCQLSVRCEHGAMIERESPSATAIGLVVRLMYVSHRR